MSYGLNQRVKAKVDTSKDERSPVVLIVCTRPQFPHYIVACQRVGVSNKPTLGSRQRQDTGSGIIAITTDKKKLKKKRTAHLTRFLLRQGEPGTSQYK